MAVMIEGMEMPEGCISCQFAIEYSSGGADGFYCSLLKPYTYKWGETIKDDFKFACCPLREVGKDINVPSKTGRWIEFDDYNTFSCSVCGILWTTIEGTPQDNGMNYCPHCGAKMEGANK